MGNRRKRQLTPSQSLARRLSHEELELKRSLVEARESAGLTQTDVANKLGVNRSAISRFERLDSNPTLSMVRHYAHAVGAMVRHSVETGALEYPEVWNQAGERVHGGFTATLTAEVTSYVTAVESNPASVQSAIHLRSRARDYDLVSI